jgi:TRAP-type C4-dicarboxylate transport system permease small subunit
MSLTEKVKGRVWIGPARQEKFKRLLWYASYMCIAVCGAVYLAVASWFMYHELLRARVMHDAANADATKFGFIVYGIGILSFIGVFMWSWLKFADTWRGIDRKRK